MKRFLKVSEMLIRSEKFTTLKVWWIESFLKDSEKWLFGSPEKLSLIYVILASRYTSSEMTSIDKVFVLSDKLKRSFELQCWSYSFLEDSSDSFSTVFCTCYSFGIRRYKKNIFYCSYHISGRFKTYSQNRKDTRRICCLHQKLLY